MFLFLENFHFVAPLKWQNIRINPFSSECHKAWAFTIGQDEPPNKTEFEEFEIGTTNNNGQK